jgi:hypothetical protein
MNLLLLLPLTIPFLCLALLSLVAFLAVVSLAGALRLFGVIKSVLGTSRPGAEHHPRHGMTGDAHPLDFVKGSGSEDATA